MKCKCKERRLIRVRRTTVDKVLGIKQKYRCATCSGFLKVKG